jgi:hypothetical protein
LSDGVPPPSGLRVTALPLKAEGVSSDWREAMVVMLELVLEWAVLELDRRWEQGGRLEVEKVSSR